MLWSQEGGGEGGVAEQWYPSCSEEAGRGESLSWLGGKQLRAVRMTLSPSPPPHWGGCGTQRVWLGYGCSGEHHFTIFYYFVQCQYLFYSHACCNYTWWLTLQPVLNRQCFAWCTQKLSRHMEKFTLFYFCSSPWWQLSNSIIEDILPDHQILKMKIFDIMKNYNNNQTELNVMILVAPCHQTKKSN